METDDRYHKIITHFALVGELSNDNDVLLLVEKEYLKQVSKTFWQKVYREFQKQTRKCIIIYYTVDKKSRTTKYFDSSWKILSLKSLENSIENIPLCFDILTSGEAFYKKGSSSLDKLKRVVVVKLFSDSWKAFSYSKKDVVKIWKNTEKVKKQLQHTNNLKLNDLELTIQNLNNIDSYVPNPASVFQVGEVRYLPFGLVNIPLTKQTKLGGILNLEEARYETITTRKGTKNEKLLIEIKNNKVVKFKIREKPYSLKNHFKAVHLTFGANPFMNYKNRVVMLERTYGWVCLGIEDSSNTHIDICFEYKLLKPGRLQIKRFFQI